MSFSVGFRNPTARFCRDFWTAVGASRHNRGARSTGARRSRTIHQVASTFPDRAPFCRGVLSWRLVGGNLGSDFIEVLSVYLSLSTGYFGF